MSLYSTLIFEEAISVSDFEVLKWTRQKGFQWCYISFNAAATRGDLKILKWLYSEGCHIRSVNALSYQKLEILKFIHNISP